MRILPDDRQKAFPRQKISARFVEFDFEALPSPDRE
jgi:hypothetical protein